MLSSPTRFLKTLCAATVASLCFLPGCASMEGTGSAPAFWSRLEQGGYVLILPHAGSPEVTLDAPELTAGDCASRNHLSTNDKRVLQRLSNEMRSRNITVDRALTSHDCRCVETAGILFGQAQPWSIIDDGRRTDPELADQRRAALVEAVSRWSSDSNLSIVTHQATISGAFGISMTPAELLLIEPLGDQGFRVVGRLIPDD